jgi:hypothetical protein
VRTCLQLLYIILGYFSIQLSWGQDCSINNHAFKFGERIDYTIYYHLAGVWIPAGEVTFRIDSARFGKQQYYHFDSYGTTYKKYDWIYKVRDHYESYTHTKSFKPLRFKRSVNEGSTFIREDYLYRHDKKQIITLRQMEEEQMPVKDTVALQGCGFDVLSLIYFSRNLDFSEVNVDEKIPISLFIDNQNHQSYIRYLGKEIIKLKDKGSFRCIKFAPYLIEGTIFNAGEDMTVWVTDDENRVPLLIETPILVGSIRAKMEQMEGLRHPLKSKVAEK